MVSGPHRESILVQIARRKGRGGAAKKGISLSFSGLKEAHVRACTGYSVRSRGAYTRVNALAVDMPRACFLSWRPNSLARYRGRKRAGALIGEQGIFARSARTGQRTGAVLFPSGFSRILSGHGRLPTKGQLLASASLSSSRYYALYTISFHPRSYLVRYSGENTQVRAEPVVHTVCPYTHQTITVYQYTVRS